MSVLIKIPMPQNCYECRFCETYLGHHLCVAFLNYIEDPRRGRLDTCPLDEPPGIDPEKFVEDYCRPRNLMVVAAEDFHMLAEQKRGKWEHHIGIGNVALLKCGECGFTYPELLGMMLFNFCPNCGARMESSEE